ncbi:MAG: polysaccharide biosynthesis/export family protein, partial [Planctomycetota bacterium]|nr:polysaccharide biosynthesis/export family protein [Planctomycetota bacterium]
MRTRTILFILAAMAAFVAASGCRDKKPPPYCPPGAPADTSEEEYWRETYRRRRPTPPKAFSVPPKAPRDNSFGEFDENLHRGLNAQPGLPPLPADDYPAPAAYPPAHGGRTEYGPPSTPPPASAPRPTPLPAAPAVSGTPFAPTAARAPSGSAKSEPLPRYVPVEQLIYGGDHGESDRPDEYRLMPKDVVTFTVRDHPEFSGAAEIQPDGTVRIPNAPDLVGIRGLTPDMAAEEIRKTLQSYVVGDCAVRVQANRARGGYYHVHGDVLQPGRFPMGMEPVKLSEAILAANWEANPSRFDMDGDELSPSFPAAAPRGRYISPQTADLARVMLVTPHRSRPARTVHDVRGALLGRTGDDPVVRPGQIIIVPSLIAERNERLGIDAPPPASAALPRPSFFDSATSARLPEV